MGKSDLGGGVFVALKGEGGLCCTLQQVQYHSMCYEQQSLYVSNNKCTYIDDSAKIKKLQGVKGQTKMVVKNVDSAKGHATVDCTL